MCEACNYEKPENYTEDREITMVREFHQKFGMVDNAGPWFLTKRKAAEMLNRIQDELWEAGSAYKLGLSKEGEFFVPPDISATDVDGVNDIVCLDEVARELLDIVYLVKGMAVGMGLPWAALFDALHEANMRKERYLCVGPVELEKPSGWTAPELDAVIDAFLVPQHEEIGNRRDVDLSTLMVFDEELRSVGSDDVMSREEVQKIMHQQFGVPEPLPRNEEAQHLIDKIVREAEPLPRNEAGESLLASIISRSVIIGPMSGTYIFGDEDGLTTVGYPDATKPEPGEEGSSA